MFSKLNIRIKLLVLKISTSMSTSNFIKIARENEDFLRDNCTANELSTFRLNIPRLTSSFNN